jgi:DNA-binding GntR family transcriptional regulator
MMQRYEIETWLGDTWTPEQTKELADQIEALDNDNEADWVSVCQNYDGTLDLAAAGDTFLQAIIQAEDARVILHADIRQAAKTMSESEIARVTGVTRMTVRKALGK